MAEHLKSKQTGGCIWPDGSPCSNNWGSNSILLALNAPSITLGEAQAGGEGRAQRGGHGHRRLQVQEPATGEIFNLYSADEHDRLREMWTNRRDLLREKKNCGVGLVTIFSEFH